MRIFKLLIIAVGSVAAVTAAFATETITYTYDAKGRVVLVAHSGTVNNAVTAAYTHDNADNRKQVQGN